MVLLLAVASLCASAQERSAPASQRATLSMRNSFRDVDQPSPMGTARSIANLLIDLTPAQRENAALDLTVSEETGADAHGVAKMIEQQCRLMCGNKDRKRQAN